MNSSRWLGLVQWLGTGTDKSKQINPLSNVSTGYVLKMLFLRFIEYS